MQWSEELRQEKFQLVASYVGTGRKESMFDLKENSLSRAGRDNFRFGAKRIGPIVMARFDLTP